MSLIHFFFNDTATTEIYTLSLHDALPICGIGLYQRGRTARICWVNPLQRFQSLCHGLLPGQIHCPKRQELLHDHLLVCTLQRCQLESETVSRERGRLLEPKRESLE